jgi:hypothetical protein
MRDLRGACLSFYWSWGCPWNLRCISRPLHLLLWDKVLYGMRMSLTDRLGLIVAQYVERESSEACYVMSGEDADPTVRWGLALPCSTEYVRVN